MSIAPEAADEHFGWLTMVVIADIPASSALTREPMGWQPIGPDLLGDLDTGHYFQLPVPVHTG